MADPRDPFSPEQLSRTLDTLTLAEVVLTREAHRALSAPVYGVGNAYLSAAGAIEQCINAVASSTQMPQRDRAGLLKGASDRALIALSALASFLPPSTGRFAEAESALRKIAGACDVILQSAPPAVVIPTNRDESTRGHEPSAACDQSAGSQRRFVAPPDFVDRLLERGEGGIGVAGFMYPLRDTNFDPWRLEGRGVSDDRFAALTEGAPPTEDEVALWKEAERNRIHEDGEGAWHPAILYRVTREGGDVLYAVVLQEDGGSWVDVFGPFHTPKAALENLRSRGELFDVSWPE